MQLSSVFCQRRPATPGSTRLRHRQHSLAGRTQQRSVVVRAEGPKDVYVLDDGVIVNSTLRKTHKGINNALKQCQSPWYVSSAHSAEQTAPLLTELTGNDFPEDSPRLLAGLDPPEDKLPEALRGVLGRPLVKESGAKVSYFNDSMKVLQAVRKDDALKDVKLYLTDWGDGQEEDASAARSTEGIAVLNIDQFSELLSWGIVMGVDDGCGDDN